MDIEENINKLKARFLNIKWIYSNRLGLTKTQYEDIKQLINDILAEREEDKKKIAELEEQQGKFYNGELYTAKQLKQIEENQKKYFINKQKVKDKIEEIKEDKENKYFDKFYMARDINYAIEILEDILEDK